MPPCTTPPALLLIGCAARKHPAPGLLPALERYDGPTYRLLRKAAREGRWPPTLDLVILSTRYGLITAGTPIACYDQRLTPARAQELAPAVGVALTTLLEISPYAAVFINLGAVYRLMLTDGPPLADLAAQGRLTWASGGIGQRLAQTTHWLAQLSLAPPPP